MNFDIREDQQKRKDQLKSIATEIRTKKQEYKDACKEHQKLHKSFNLDKWLSINDCWYDGDITKTVRVIISKSIFNLKDLQQKLNDLSGRCRILHTIYCLYNGTPLDKIEKRVYHYNVSYDMYRLGEIADSEYVKELGRYWKWKYAFTASCIKWVDYEAALNHQKLLEKRKMFVNLTKMNLY